MSIGDASSERDDARQRLLFEAAVQLLPPLHAVDAIASIAKLVIPHFADWCVVHLDARDGEPPALFLAHRDPASERTLRELYARLAGDERGTAHYPDVFRAAAPALVLRDPDGLRTYVLAPVRSRGVRAGAIALVRETDVAYEPADLALLEDLAHRVGIAYDEARAYRALRRERDRLAEECRTKDEFIAMVSHELRSPLNAIIGWTRMLRLGLTGKERAGRALETIERNANILTRRVDELLDVSRIIAGSLRLELRPVDLLEVLTQTIEALRPSCDAKSITVCTCLDANAGPIVGDADRLRQVAYNLLTNAIKFTPPRGKIEITLAHAGAHVELAISDSGCGIRPEVLPYVFERFRQGDAAIARTYGGLGLGLAIARHLVELHGGTIEASSDGEGRGARFLVRLPIASAE